MRKKIIQVTVRLNGKDQVFTAKGDNKLQSMGLAISANITYGNGAMAPTAQITIYGLPMSSMAPLFRVQWNTMSAILNTVKIEAGEQGGELTKVYEGNITFATINMNAAPNEHLVITSQMAVVEKMKATPALEIKEGQDAADVIEKISKEMGYAFENYEANHILTATSLNGSNLEKIEKLAAMCDFDLYVEQGLIVICKKGTARPVKIPIISPTTGLIGYPEPDQRGISFSCLYDPAIKFGGIVTVKDSLIEIANADWRVYGLVSTLEANLPQGKWQSAVNATWRDSKDAAVQR